MSDAYSIEYAEQAERTLRRLDKATAKRIAHKIVWLAENASWRTPARERHTGAAAGADGAPQRRLGPQM